MAHLDYKRSISYDSPKLLLVHIFDNEFPMPIQINITSSGRMSLPADLRKRLGISAGGVLFLQETADGVILFTAAQAVAHAQALAKQYTSGNPGSGVDAFLVNRDGSE